MLLIVEIRTVLVLRFFAMFRLLYDTYLDGLVLRP